MNMENSVKPGRDVALDLVRVAAIFLVLLQHASEYYYIGPNLSVIHENCGLLAWLNSLSRICVPLFVMISGYFVLPMKTDTPTFFRHRFSRVLFPWLFWCVAYAVYFVFYRGDSVGECLGNICRIPLNWGVEVGHLWYVYMIVGLYLLIPIISPWLSSSSKRELQGYLALWLLTTLLPYLHHAGINLWGEATWNMTPTFYYFAGFGGYFLLGHYVRRFGVPSAWLSALLLVGGYIFTALDFNHFTTFAKDAVELEIPWDFCCLNVALMTLAVFSLLSKVKTNPESRVARLITSISVCSFAMYLAHIMVLNFFHDLWDSVLPVAAAIPAITICTFIVTYLIVLCLSRLPKGKYWLGI